VVSLTKADDRAEEDTMKKVLLVLVVLVAGLVAVVATRPDNLHIERSATIAAPPQYVAGLVNDFHRWSEWAPWDKLDPSMKKEFEGGPGVGAKYHWSGNDKVGEGKMSITTSQADKIVIELEFMKPFAATSSVTFTFKPEGSATKVVWASDGKQSFMAKGYGLVKNMDQMIGKDYADGLAAMAPIAVADAQKAAAAEAAQKAAAAEAAQKAAALAAATPPPVPAKAAKGGKKK
jgi:hypothetical protein